MKIFKWWMNAIAFNECLDDPLLMMVGTAFWVMMGMSFFVGANTAYENDRCKITRLVQRQPAYVTGCVLWGKRFPEIKL